MRFKSTAFSPSAWVAATGLAVVALVAGCGGGGHAALPLPSSPAQSAAAGGTRTGTLSVKIQLPVGGTLTKTSVKRSPEYVSGLTQGVYIVGTCLVGGGTVTQSCTGASFPAVYADVSAGSPLCSGTPRTCTLSASPVAGFSYAVTVAALDSAPTGEVNGYGTGFPSTATELSVGSNPAPMPAATGSPGPAPTPTALGAFVGRGTANSLSIGLNAIATQFVQVNPISGAATDNVIPITAIGTNYSFNVFFSAGDAAGNLIAPPASCMATYAGEVGSGGGATIANPFFPNTTVGPSGCDKFAGPDGKEYALSITSALPTHVCSVPQTPGPCSSGTIPSTYETTNFPPLSVLLGLWTQAPPGVLTANPSLQWDGIADNDTACTPSCGVPIALTLSNNIPATVTPIIGKTSSYNVTNVNQFFLAPFVTTLACGTNTACAGTTTASNCIGFCAQLALNNGGTAKAKVFLYAAGGVANLAGNTGCYTTACFNIAVNGTPPANISPCYTGLNPFTGQPSGTATCNDVPDPAAGSTLPAGTVDCKSPSNAPNPGTTIALIEPGAFQKGVAGPPGVADTMAFVVQAVTGPTTGFCNFQIVDPNRTPAVYSLPILVQVTTTGTVIVVPPNQPFPTPGPNVASVAFSITPNKVQGPSPATATLTAIAKDSGGNTISGTAPYPAPINVSSNDTTGGITLSAPAFTKPGDIITVTYSGAAPTTSTTFTTTSVGNVTPVTLAIPPPHQSLYVADASSIFVFAPGANGNVTPVRTIAGANTGLFTPHAVALDANQNIYVTNYNNSITVYSPDANGNATPIRTISGSSTGLVGNFQPWGITLDPTGNIFIVMYDFTTFSGGGIEEFAAGSNGNVAPIKLIQGAATDSGDANSIVVDGSGNMDVAGTSPIGIAQFAPSASGNVAPNNYIAGANTLFNSPVNGVLMQQAFDTSGNLWVAEIIPPNPSRVMTFAPNVTGNVAPTTILAGLNTGMTNARGLAFDLQNNMYVSNSTGSVVVFASGASGNIAPIRTISGANTGLSLSRFIAINP